MPDPAILDELIELGGLPQVLKWLDDVRTRIDAIYPAAVPTINVTDDFLAANHTLISQAGMLGFTALSEACRLVETSHQMGEDIEEPIRRCRVEAGRAIVGCRTFAASHAVEVVEAPRRFAVG